MNIRFTAEIVSDGTAFALKMEISKIPNEAQANEIGAALSEAIRSYFDAKGANLVREDGAAPFAATPPRILQS